jgi:hypothetical protein
MAIQLALKIQNAALSRCLILNHFYLCVKYVMSNIFYIRCFEVGCWKFEPYGLGLLSEDAEKLLAVVTRMLAQPTFR